MPGVHLMIAAENSLAVLEIFERGGPIMWVILAGAVLGIAFVFERLLSLRAHRVLPPDLVQRISTLVDQGKIRDARVICAEHSAFIAPVFAAALEAKERDASRAEIKERVEEVGARQVARLERHIEIVGTVASVSPLLGLFGTVVGMIQVFRRFSEAYATGAASPDRFADGIYTALITTAYGLLIAIPMLVAYKFLQGRCDRWIVEMEAAAMALVDRLMGESDKDLETSA